MANTIELRQKRAQLIKDARGILDVAEKETRGLSAEERVKYDKIYADIDNLAETIKAEERQAEMEREIDTPMKSDPSLRHGPEDAGKQDKKHWTARPEYRKAFWEYMSERGSESAVRALQMDSDPAGGYTVAPHQWVSDLIAAKKNMVVVRQLARTFSVPKAESLGAPALATEPADGEWTGEITARSEETAMTFGKRELTPHPLAKLIKVSKKLIRSSAIDIEAFVRDRMAYKFAVTEEQGFLTGNGANQPLGVFTASNDGISTGRNMATGNTATAITADNLLNNKYNLKMQYRTNCAWIFHRDAVKMIAKLKDGEGRYLLVPDLRGSGNVDRLLSFPVYESEYAPNTFTSGLYVGILGDFSNYWIADALNMTIQALFELYAATNQNGYIGLLETDGMPVLEEAFTRVTLG